MNRSVKVTKTFNGGHTSCSSDKFPEGTLPTKQDDIDQVLSEDNFFSKSTARRVAAEHVEHTEHNIRSKPSYVAKESQFMSDVEKLFNIFCEDNQ